jgi:hypothetical protein
LTDGGLCILGGFMDGPTGITTRNEQKEDLKKAASTLTFQTATILHFLTRITWRKLFCTDVKEEIYSS